MKGILKSNAFRMIIALSLIGMLSGIALVFVFKYSMPRIEKNIKEETRKAIETIFPELAKVEELEEGKVFAVRDKNGDLTGYAFVAEGNGYQGTIKLIAGIDPAFSESFSKNRLREANSLELKTPMVLMINGRYDMEGFLMLLKSFKNVKKRI